VNNNIECEQLSNMREKRVNLFILTEQGIYA